MIEKIGFKRAKEIIDGNKDCVILDVRSEDEYITGHAEDALNFPLNEISDVTAEEFIPSYDTPVLVYCRSGRRSFEAARILDELGYEKIYDMGSLVGWPYGIV